LKPDEFKGTNNGDITIKLNETQKNMCSQLSESLKKVKVIELSVDECLNNITSEIKIKYGKEPSHGLYGMQHDGSPIFAFTIDNKIVHRTGFSISHNSAGQKVIQLVNLT